MKKLLIVGIVILVIGGLGYLAYVLFLKPREADKLVRELFWKYFGYEPDAPTVSRWAEKLTSGAITQSQMELEWASTPEYKARVQKLQSVSANPTETVRQLYLTILNREPDQEGLQGHVFQYANGHQTLESLKQEFYASPERKVIELYQAVLGRNPTLAEQDTGARQITGVYPNINQTAFDALRKKLLSQKQMFY